MGESRVQNVSVLKKQQKWKKKKYIPYWVLLFWVVWRKIRIVTFFCWVLFIPVAVCASVLSYTPLLAVYSFSFCISFNFRCFSSFFFLVCVLLSEGSQGRQFQVLLSPPVSGHKFTVSFIVAHLKLICLLAPKIEAHSFVG